MAGSLFDFIISTVALCIIVGLIFVALDWPAIAPDPGFKKIARYAVGGAAVIVFLMNVKAVFFGGGGAVVGPVAILEFAIGLIVLVVVLYVINWVLDWLAPGVPFIVPLKFVISAVAVILLLVIAEQALFGGGLGLVGQRGAPFHLTR